jgi:7,8-dihydropterin-6-yl-methyl-4-(beta-D-ribofuranosyl)aminobenzene 5'-phosphate synthase
MKNILFFIALFLSVPTPVKAIDGIGTQITLTDLFDNFLSNPPIKGTTTDWGFSCLIEGTEKTILFDTGGGLSGYNGYILIQNINSLGKIFDNIDLIVISHDHPDHTGGLNNVLAIKTGIPVYLGYSLGLSFRQNVTNKGAIPVRVKESVEICKDVYSTGNLTGAPNEQSLVIDTPDGLVVITGCAHPGIVNILQKVKQLFSKNIYMVIGGFHMQYNIGTPSQTSFPDSTINRIIQDFKSLGVKKVGPTHCTGDRALALFKEAYGQDYVTLGVGKVIQLPTYPVKVREENDGKSDVPNHFKLEQNNPNPFNPSTTIQYAIPEGPEVTARLQIYDIRGCLVRTLVDGVRGPGMHTAVWKGSDDAGKRIASGVYIYRMEAGGFTNTRKMLLIK